MSNYTQLRSNLGKAKNLGPAGSGVHHWLHQRITAIIMLPLMVWLAYFIYATAGLEAQDVMKHLREPFNLIPAISLLIASLYHGMLGMQVVIEDYINCIKSRYFLIISVKIFTLLTILSAVVALIRI